MALIEALLYDRASYRNSADLEALVNLSGCWQRANLRAPQQRIHSTLSPNPNAFQWVLRCRRPYRTAPERAQNAPETPGLRVKWHDPGHSFLEAVFARGDRRLGEVLIRAWS